MILSIYKDVLMIRADGMFSLNTENMPILLQKVISPHTHLPLWDRVVVSAAS